MITVAKLREIAAHLPADAEVFVSKAGGINVFQKSTEESWYIVAEMNDDEDDNTRLFSRLLGH